MARPNKGQAPKQKHARPPWVDEAAKQRQKAQEREVAGRHKQDGQNDQQGHKTSK